jgi:hypothetical protein
MLGRVVELSSSQAAILNQLYFITPATDPSPFAPSKRERVLVQGLPAENGDVPTWIGDHWEALQPGAAQGVLLNSALQSFSRVGTLVPVEGDLPWVVDIDIYVVGFIMAVGDAPIGDDITVDMKNEGQSIFNFSLPRIPAGSTSSQSLTPDVSYLPSGNRITIDITSVGSTFPGANLTITIRYRTSPS